MLSDEEIRRYHETGWLVVPDVLDQETLATLRTSLDGLVAGAAGLTTHNALYDLEPDHRPDAPRVRRIKTPHEHLPPFRELCRLPKLVAILGQLLGPSGVRLHGSKINLKQPHYGSPVEWHQDWAFYPHTNDDVLAVGVMLDDVTPENGPMLVVPGSHKGPVFDHHSPDGYFCGALDPTCAGLDFANAEAATGRAGSMSFHHVRLVHGSAQNRSDRQRRLLLYEFAAADAFPLLGIKDFAAWNDLLVAGEPTNVPRSVWAPIRMPLPPAPRQGSIYENQTTAEHHYFARAADLKITAS